MSLKPCVVARTTLAVWPVSSAFVAAVVPWKIIRTDSGSTPASASAASACTNASPGSPGVDGTFATRTLPSTLVAIASVNVPPMSMPTTQRESATGALRREVPDQRRHLGGKDLQSPPLHVPLEPREIEPGDKFQIAARRPPVFINRAGHLRRRPEDDGLAQRVGFGARHRRRQPRLAGLAPRVLHVLVLPGHVPAAVPDQLPGVPTVPGQDRPGPAGRESPPPPPPVPPLP